MAKRAAGVKAIEGADLTHIKGESRGMMHAAISR